MKSLIMILSVLFLCGIAVAEEKTKYAEGDKFMTDTGDVWELIEWVPTRTEGCENLCSEDWCLSIHCMPTYHDYRWKIIIHSTSGADMEAATDDVWLDKLRHINP